MVLVKNFRTNALDIEKKRVVVASSCLVCVYTMMGTKPLDIKQKWKVG